MSGNEIPAKIFESSDLYLSAALLTVGYKLLRVKTNDNNRGIFVFEDRGDRPQTVIAYFNSSLMGSFKAFSNNWADLKNLVQLEMENRNGKHYR
jgi:hypothetical protein